MTQRLGGVIEEVGSQVQNPTEWASERGRGAAGRRRERRTMESANTHPNITERPVGTFPTVDEKSLTTISNGKKTIRSAAGSVVGGGGVEETRDDALGNGQIHRVHRTAPCRGGGLESGRRRRFRPGHGVETEHVGVAIRLPGAALATEDDEPPLGWVVAHRRVHQRRRARPRGGDLEPL